MLNGHEEGGSRVVTTISPLPPAVPKGAVVGEIEKPHEAETVGKTDPLLLLKQLGAGEVPLHESR